MDRARDELREHGDIDGHLERVAIRGDPAAMHVDEVGDRMKREKGNPDRQSQFGQRKGG